MSLSKNCFIFHFLFWIKIIQANESYEHLTSFFVTESSCIHVILHLYFLHCLLVPQLQVALLLNIIPATICTYIT